MPGRDRKDYNLTKCLVIIIWIMLENYISNQKPQCNKTVLLIQGGCVCMHLPSLPSQTPLSERLKRKKSMKVEGIVGDQ